MLERKMELLNEQQEISKHKTSYAVLCRLCTKGGWWSGEGKGVHSSIFSRGNLREQSREFVSF
jgi:hypothetical protein